MPGDEFDDGLGEIGGELDMDAVSKAATTVRRRPLDLGLGEMLPRQSRSGGRQAGGASLDADAFLDRLGTAAVRPARSQGPTMERALNIQQQGMPTWGWILLLLGTFAVGFGIFMTWIWATRTYDVSSEADRIEAAAQRVQQLERERQRGID